MKRIVTALLAVACCLSATAQIGTWKTYMAYHNIQQIQAAGDDIFVLASNDVYMYNKNDRSITTFDRINGLNDTYITFIKWCKSAKRLVAVYSNSNIDLIETNSNIINVSDIYSKAIIGDKTISNVIISGKFAYLCSGFGIIKMNVQNAEISETYNLGQSIKSVGFSGNSIYARTATGKVLTATLTANLVDPGNWTATTAYNSSIFAEDNADYNEYLSLVETLKPGGPKYNNFYEIKFINNTLYTVGGAFTSKADMNYPGTVQVLKGDEWTIYQDQLDTITKVSYVDTDCIDVDPNDNRRVFVGARTGLYEFYDGMLKRFYSIDDGLLPAYDKRVLDANYVIVNGIKFDKEGNLWIFDCQSKDANLFVIEKGSTTLQSRFSPTLVYENNIGLSNMRGCYLDSNGLIWTVNDHWRRPSLICLQPSDTSIVRYSSFINQDGMLYTLDVLHCVVEDTEGNIWIGTNHGPFYITAGEIGQQNVTFQQFKVPRNDGTNYADYLLSGVEISCIAIDGAGRKWFGTNGQGIYVISADNMTQINHFLTTNSKLLSNSINAISINQQTGEVYIATEAGLCSYSSDATEPSDAMDKNSVYAYPNPVSPDYNGVITIMGLTFNAEVKITTATGYLVAEGTSNGGTFTWDGTDRKGRRVASGVYNVITATADGNKGTVCKIAIIK
jgi:hypothetical protein